jgi:hypothetical protein
MVDRLKTEKTIDKIRKRLESRMNYRADRADRADGGPGSGNWGHKGRPGEIGGSGEAGGASNREFREKIGFISKKRQGDEKLCQRAIAKGKKARQAVQGLFKSNHETWERCRDAVSSGKPIPSGTEAEKNHVIVGASKEAQAAYDAARSHEKNITKDMVEIAGASGTEMYGLDFSIKTGKSMADKISRKRAGFIAKQEEPPSDEEIVKSLTDMVRYTQLCKHDDIAKVGKSTIESLKSKGYEIEEISNKWMDPKSYYKGLHILATNPEGQTFELQIHSKESMEVKEQLHPMYEEERKANASAYTRDTLAPAQAEISKTLSMPKGIDDPALRDWKRGGKK